jgi:hypothetical protein
MKDTRPMAEQTWPLFERKWRRKLFWKRWKSKMIFAGSLLLVIILAFLYRIYSFDQKGIKEHLKQPQKEQILKSKIQDELQGKTQIKIGSSLGADVMDSLSSPFEPQFFKLNSKCQMPILTNGQGSIQKNADLQLAFAYLNLQPQSWSLQSNEHSLSALLDKKTLLIMNLMQGTESLPAFPSDFGTESWYRPDFFPADHFVHIAFYDVADWIQDPLSVKLSVNRVSNQIPIAPWRTSSNPSHSSAENLQRFTAFDREYPGVFVYRGPNLINERSLHSQYRKNSFIADRPAESFNPLLYDLSDTLIVVSAQVQRITKLSMYGILFGSKEITFKSKGIHSAKRREPLLDPVDNTLYVLAPTNFHFVFFKVDLTTGCATQIYQTASIWPGAEFEIYDGILHYNYKTKEVQVDLKQFKVE